MVQCMQLISLGFVLPNEAGRHHAGTTCPPVASLAATGRRVNTEHSKETQTFEACPDSRISPTRAGRALHTTRIPTRTHSRLPLPTGSTRSLCHPHYCGTPTRGNPWFSAYAFPGTNRV